MIKNAFELKTIGNMLIERRKQKGFSIEQIAEITKIRKKYIEALESSNYEIFESEIYIKGFLRNYTKMLGINAERALAMYRRERQFQDKREVINSPNKIKNTNRNLELTPNKIIIGVVAIIVAITVFYIGSYIGKILEDPVLTITSPITVAANSTETYKTDQDVLEISGDIDIGSSLTINGQKYETNSFTTYFTKLNLTEGKNEFKLVATTEFGKDTSIDFIVIYEPTESEEIEENEAEELENTVEELSINIKVSGRESYLSLFLDDEEASRKIYQPGANLDFTATEEIRLSSPRPDTLTVIVNEKEYKITSSSTHTWTLDNGEVTFKN